MDYQSNSRKDREPKEEKRIEKVVVSEVIQRPVSVGFKLRNIFLGDNLKTTSAYVVNDIFWPQTRILFFDIIVEGLRNMVFARGAMPRRSYDRSYQQQNMRISYDNPIRPDWRDGREYRDARARSYPPDQAGRRIRPEPTEIIIASREEAEAVLERMIDIIQTYESVSLADYYDMLGLAASPVDNKWGWLFLNNAKVNQTREGYVIDLPRMEVL
jgi:hypothetical protein